MNLSFTYIININYTNLHINKIYLDEYNKNESVYKKYIIPEKYIESDNIDIINFAKNITKTSKDIFNASINILEWIYHHINYTGFSFEPRGALWALKNNHGDCSEFTFLYIALCRASGIPARFIDGIANNSFIEGGTFDWITIGHDWAEIYVPSIGWIWVDPTWNLFGARDGVHIAIQHGQNSSSIKSGYRFSYSSKEHVNVTEFFKIYPIK